jgi:HK97 gp10 family phage protein
MAKIEADSSDLDDIVAFLESKSESLDKVPAIIAAAADVGVTIMQEVAPVRTGYMRDHIAVIEKDDTHVVIESQAPYSGFVEYGTSKQKAQPFFRPGVEQTIQEASERLNDWMNED